MGQSPCLLRCISSDTQGTRHKRNFRKLTTALEKDVTNAKSRFQKKGQPQQGPNKHRTSKYTDNLQSIEHVSR